MPLYQQWQLVLVVPVADLLRRMKGLRSEWRSQTELELASDELSNLDGKRRWRRRETRNKFWGQYESE